MIERKLRHIILSRLKLMPSVGILGPRQVGKTTLAKTLSSVYYDLELEEEKVRLDLQWNDIINSDETIVLDEAQNHPEIFPRIRGAIDKERKRNGRFLILGSVSPGLMREVSELLTGRIAVCELTPFSIKELGNEKENALWLMGGYPDGGILQKENFPMWQQNYLELLAMRDFPLWGMPAKPEATKRFFKMLAASNGTIWNASQIGKSLGISYHTVNSYLDFLEGAYLIRRLQPYHTNIKKRLVKSPKIYWRDSGLLHSLLNIRNMDELIVQPWVGTSWEGWVIEQILIFLNSFDIDYDGPYFFRTNDGHELDLILTIFGSAWGIEIKLGSSPGPGDLQRLSKVGDLINADIRVLVSRTDHSVEGHNTISTNIRGLLELLKNRS
jgi:predicted AAA+ superfamily ATPase